MALILKTVLFTIFMPGTVVVLLPYLIRRYAEIARFESDVAQVGGIVLIVAGAMIYLRCAWDFVSKGKGTPMPFDAPKFLVSGGLYRYTRNPMYVGISSILVGQALALGSVSTLVYFAVVFVVINLFIVYYEEPHLRSLYGESYEVYLRSVGRWW